MLFFLKKSLIKYKRKKDTNKSEAAWIPPVSEKKSKVKPYKKAANKKRNRFLFNGNKNIKEMYRYGLMCWEKFMLFNTNIWRKRMIIIHKKTRILFIVGFFKIHKLLFVKIFNNINIFQATHIIKELNIYNSFNTCSINYIINPTNGYSFWKNWRHTPGYNCITNF